MRDQSSILMPGRAMYRVSFSLLPLLKKGETKLKKQYYKANGKLLYLYGPMHLFCIKIFWGTTA